jgi:hypothetical protein
MVTKGGEVHGDKEGGGGRDDEEGEECNRGRGPSSKLTIEPSPCLLDVPLEFVREVARASAVAEAGHVKGRPVARHGSGVEERKVS